MGICNPRNMQLGFPSQAGFVGNNIVLYVTAQVFRIVNADIHDSQIANSGERVIRLDFTVQK